MGGIENQQRRLDKMDKVEDKKISVLGSAKEETLTKAYIKEVNDLMWFCSKLGDEKLSRMVRAKILEDLTQIDETEELEGNVLKFRSSVGRWTGKVRKRIREKENDKIRIETMDKQFKETQEKLNRVSGINKEHKEKQKQKLLKNIDDQIKELKEFNDSLGEEDEWIKTEIAYLLKDLSEIKRKVEKIKYDKADLGIFRDEKVGEKRIEEAKALIRYKKLTEKMFRGVEKIDELTKTAIEQGDLENLTGEIEQQIKEAEKQKEEFTKLAKIIGKSKIFVIDIEADNIDFLESQYVKPLEALKKSQPYLKARKSLIAEINKRDLNDNEIRRHYQNIQKLISKNNPILLEDAEEILRNFKIELIGRATKSMDKEIERELQKAYGSDLKKYFEIKETEKGKEYILSKEVESLDAASQLELQTIITKINQKISLKAEKALLTVETRPHMKAYYEANQAMSKGDTYEAKIKYMKFLEDYPLTEGLEEFDLEEKDVKKAMEMLKIIAIQDISQASHRLTQMEKSTQAYRSWVPFEEHEFGTSKERAKKIIDSQRKVLKIAMDLIQADNGILTFEDAIEAIKGIKLEHDDTEYFHSLGMDLSDAMDADKVFGDWGTKGPAYYLSNFGGDYLANLDAIQMVTDQTAQLSKEELLKKAREYKEMGMYDMAQEMYDLYFRDKYKAYNTGDYSLKEFTRRLEEDEKKMKKINEMIDDFEKQYEEEEGKVLSPDEKKMMKKNLIESEWKDYVRLQITEAPHSEVWDEYNSDIMQIDRDWYEMWKFTCQEWDRFVEELPIEIVALMLTAGAAGAVGKKATAKIAQKVIIKELAKLGIKEAFKKGGLKLAMKTLAAKLGPKAAGFIAESLAFSELGMVSSSIRTGDFSALVDWEAHLEGFGHSALTLGTLRVVNGPLKGLQKIKGVKGAVTRGTVTTIADSIALTGLNVGLASIGDSPMSSRDIAVLARDNVVLSVGIRAGQGGLKKIAQMRKPTSKPRLIEAGREFHNTITRGGLNSGLGVIGQGFWNAGKTLFERGGQKKTEKLRGKSAKEKMTGEETVEDMPGLTTGEKQTLLELFPEGIESSHIEQQNIGNCHFLAALHAAKRNPIFAYFVAKNIKRSRHMEGWNVEFNSPKKKRTVFGVNEGELQGTEGINKHTGEVEIKKTVFGQKGDKVLDMAITKYLYHHFRGARMKAKKYYREAINGGLSVNTLKAMFGLEGKTVVTWSHKAFGKGLHSRWKVKKAETILDSIGANPDLYIATAGSKGNRKYVRIIEYEIEKKGKKKTKKIKKYYADPQLEFVGKHAYAIVGVDPVKRTVTLANPHGTKSKTKTITYKQFMEYFNDIDSIRLSKAKIADRYGNVRLMGKPQLEGKLNTGLKKGIPYKFSTAESSMELTINGEKHSIHQDMGGTTFIESETGRIPLQKEIKIGNPNPSVSIKKRGINEIMVEVLNPGDVVTVVKSAVNRNPRRMPGQLNEYIDPLVLHGFNTTGKKIQIVKGGISYELNPLKNGAVDFAGELITEGGSFMIVEAQIGVKNLGKGRVEIYSLDSSNPIRVVETNRSTVIEKKGDLEIGEKYYYSLDNEGSIDLEIGNGVRMRYIRISGERSMVKIISEKKGIRSHFDGETLGSTTIGSNMLGSTSYPGVLPTHVTIRDIGKGIISVKPIGKTRILNISK
jgi:hypothetical protein